MSTFEWVKQVCEYCEGCDVEPPPGLEWLASGWARGLWWGTLIGGVLLFCGQTSKFIYIDF